MKKKGIVLGVMAATLLTSAVVYASPMTSMEKGTGKVDASLAFGSSLLVDEGDVSGDLDGKNRYRLGATYGLGDKWGIEYKYVNNEAKYENFSLQSNQLNVLYQFNPNVAAFAGYVNNRGKVEYGEGEDGKASQSGYQVGVLGRMDIAKRTSAWASIGVGNVITAYEVGVGYDLTHNFDLNLFYNDTKYKDLGGLDIKTHSVNLGVTYHF